MACIILFHEYLHSWTMNEGNNIQIFEKMGHLAWIQFSSITAHTFTTKSNMFKGKKNLIIFDFFLWKARNFVYFPAEIMQSSILQGILVKAVWYVIFVELNSSLSIGLGYWLQNLFWLEKIATKIEYLASHSVLSKRSDTSKQIRADFISYMHKNYAKNWPPCRQRYKHTNMLIFHM